MAKKLSTLLPMTDMASGQFKGQSIFWKPGVEGWAAGNTQHLNEIGLSKHKWKVPAGAKLATFEIWGGGGNGAAAHCCMQGIPGGSGAYAYKTIKVTPGNCYTFCSMIDKHCCNNYTATEGAIDDGKLMHATKGGNTSICGPGLTNFCAEGGNPGVSCCYFFHQYKHNEYQFMCDLLGRVLEDSDSDRYRRGRYFGTNTGARGNYGITQMGCCGSAWTAANWCGIKTGTPFPGGLHMWGRSARGGVNHKGLNYYCQCYMDIHDGASARLAHSVIGGSWFSKVPGEGGLTAATAAGPCCCGEQGAFGAVRVNWE